MTLYIRRLSIQDLDQCTTVETAAFPPAEAASREKIEYRLSACSEICFGLFSRDGAPPPGQAQSDIPFMNAATCSKNDTLLAHVISTRSTNRVVKDPDMGCPSGWKANPQAGYEVGHKENGRTIALHSLAVSTDYQRSGFGKLLIKSYLNQIGQTGEADRVSILTYDRLVSYYTKLGFTHYGLSESNYAGVAWHDLAYEYSKSEN